MDYQTRFIRKEHESELLSLFRLARTALAGHQSVSNYDRMLWASKSFAESHPEVSSTGAYKDLCGLIGQ